MGGKTQVGYSYNITNGLNAIGNGNYSGTIIDKNLNEFIVLLILAAVSIATLTGENGILTRAQDAKEQTIIGREKEQVELAYSSVSTNKLGENVTSGELQEELNKVVGER